MNTNVVLVLLGVFILVALLTLFYWTANGLISRMLLLLQKLHAQPLKLSVVSRQDINADLFTLTLKAVGWRRCFGLLPRFQPGQYLTLCIGKPDAKLLKRAYSLAAWQAFPFSYQLGIKREEAGRGSNWLHTHAKPGCQLTALKPQGHFVLQPSVNSQVLIAGGIGITPLRAMLHRLKQLTAPPRTRLIYSARTVEALVYHDEFTELAKTEDWFSYHPILTQPPVTWQGLKGRLCVAQLIALAGEAINSTDFYCCASNSMMDMLYSGLKEVGVSADHLFQEAFSLGANEDQQTYSVVIGTKTFCFNGQPSLLHALEEWQQPVQGDCRAGDCRRCLAKLKQGKVRWLIPETNAAQENGEILCCCTVPQTAITLALDEFA